MTSCATAEIPTEDNSHPITVASQNQESNVLFTDVSSNAWYADAIS